MTLFEASTTLASFDFPPGKTFTSYFQDVDGASLGILVLALAGCWLIYKTMVSHDGNASQFVGYLLIGLIILFAAVPGLEACRVVVIDFADAVWSWITTS